MLKFEGIRSQKYKFVYSQFWEDLWRTVNHVQVTVVLLLSPQCEQKFSKSVTIKSEVRFIFLISSYPQPRNISLFGGDNQHYATEGYSWPSSSDQQDYFWLYFRTDWPIFPAKEFYNEILTDLWPMSNVCGLWFYVTKETQIAWTYDWVWAGLLVTLQTRYFRFIVPQWVISTFNPAIKLKKFNMKL